MSDKHHSKKTQKKSHKKSQKRSLYSCGNEFSCDKINHHGYNRFYSIFLDKYTTSPITMFEIGVDYDRSMKMWKEYFHKDSKIYGMDIDYEYTRDYGQVFKGDQSDINDLTTISNTIIELNKDKCNLIVDDGSHVPEHQLLSFNYLFEHLLKKGGIYIIEDIETSYWTHGKLYGYDVRSGFHESNNIVEIFKNIVDIVNMEFLTLNNLYTVKDSLVSDYCLNNIKMITFSKNNIIIIKKDNYDIKHDSRKYRYMHFV